MGFKRPERVSDKWDGTKFLWMEMNRTRQKPNLNRLSREMPFFNFKAWFAKLMTRFKR
jgi:hypothetical protein